MYDITILQIYNYFFKSSVLMERGGGGGGGGDSPSFSFELPRLYLNESCFYSSIFGSKLEFRVSYKGVTKRNPPFGYFKNVGNEMAPLMNLKEA